RPEEPVSLDLDLPPILDELTDQDPRILQHRLTACEYHQLGMGHLLPILLEGYLCLCQQIASADDLRFPQLEVGIAPGTDLLRPEIAAGESNEHREAARKWTLALQGWEDLGNGQIVWLEICIVRLAGIEVRVEGHTHQRRPVRRGSRSSRRGR